jgi:hypothetical protein
MLVSLYAPRAAFVCCCCCCCSIHNISRTMNGERNSCACYNDVILNDAFSSNPRNLICQVASKFDIVVGIRNLLASGTSCPLPWFIWDVFYHWWRHLPLHCWFLLEALAVVCVLILWVLFWCTPPHAPWCKVLPVLLWWLMIMCAMLSTAPLFGGTVVLLERKKCPPALLRASGLLK